MVTRKIAKELLHETMCAWERLAQNRKIRSCTIRKSQQFRSASLFSILLDSKIFWIVQMILKTVCAFLAFVLELFGVYGDGEFKWRYGYVLFSVQTCTCFIIMWSWRHKNVISSIYPMNFFQFQFTLSCFFIF